MTKYYFFVTIILIFVLILGVVLYAACYVNPYLNRIQTIAEKKVNISNRIFRQLQEIEDIGEKKENENITLTKNDINSLKSSIFFLKNEIDKEIQLSRDETIGIVDRVNLYITIGIILLTLFGVFVPVLAQNFYGQDVKEKYKELKNAYKKIEGQVDNIPALRLTYSLLRALDKDLIRWYISRREESVKQLKKIFKRIKDDMSYCKKNNILPSKNEILKESLADFSDNFNFVLLTYQSRKDLDLFENLNKRIKQLVEDNTNEYETFELAITDIDTILKSI